MAWRTSSAEALEEAAKSIEAAGVQGEWFDGHKTVGPTASRDRGVTR